MWLVSGAEKADAFRRMREGDASIPAGRVRAADQRVVCDAAALGETVVG
jgi:6-phosphogluconolactonase/glucosamine-6-phosphate isomerase/deaminase